MMSIDMPTKCWFIRWYLFHVDDMKNGETSTVRREVPCRIFSRQQYLPLLLPGTGNHRSRPSQTPRRNAADKTHAAFFPTPFPENIFFKKAASEALPFPETQSTIRTGPPMRNAAYFVLSQPSGPA